MTILFLFSRDTLHSQYGRLLCLRQAYVLVCVSHLSKWSDRLCSLTLRTLTRMRHAVGWITSKENVHLMCSYDISTFCSPPSRAAYSRPMYPLLCGTSPSVRSVSLNRFSRLTHVLDKQLSQQKNLSCSPVFRISSNKAVTSCRGILTLTSVSITATTKITAIYLSFRSS
jgi:hypothetical protein